MRQSHRRIRIPAAKGGEHLLEMKLLPAIGYVNYVRGVPGFQAVAQGRKVRGGIVIAAVAFAYQRGMVFELGMVVEENREGAFTFAREP